MCGIVGFIDFNFKTSKTDLDNMVRTLNHRGPDDFGTDVFTNDDATVGFGQARLSIIDLSQGGHQPMHYKHLSIVYNGEIYNYNEIKDELIVLGHKFITKSDTEVILHAFEEWGTKSVEYFIGMFAIAILDKKENQVTFIRDRAGVKPLYYYWYDNLFLFTSELKSFHVIKSFKKEIDFISLELYFKFGYIPSPYAIFKNSFKIEPGHILQLDIKNKTTSKSCYWDVEQYYKEEKISISYEEAKHEVHDLLISASNYRMVSDVPVGVFLSGGYDSSTVTAILQSNRTEKLKTFTIGFEEGNNEAPFAKEIADFLGTDHTELICETKIAQSIITDLPLYYDEPFADSSAIPTTLVSKLARSKVTVALSADAGDEIFAGYNRYADLLNKSISLSKIPNSLISTSRSVFSIASGIIPPAFPELKHKLNGLSKSVDCDKNIQTAALFAHMSSLPDFVISGMLIKKQLKVESFFQINPEGFKNEIEIAMASDYKMYLQNDILTKVDRASMSVSLESREPLLDHRLIEYVAKLPIVYKFDGKTSKRILKDISYSYIPQKKLDRPKAGFSLPINTWLRNDLSYLIDEFLNDNAIGLSGLFNVDFINKHIKLFKINRLHYSQLIWRLLMFQMWYFKWMKS